MTPSEVIDPYDGFDSRLPLLGPWPAGVVVQDGDEPERLPLSDDAGFLVGYQEVPLVPCVQCGSETRRRIITGVHITKATASDMAFALETVAQCRSVR